jgi:hypothetical protein
MASREFRDLTEAQRETSRALHSLMRELRASAPATDFGRRAPAASAGTSSERPGQVAGTEGAGTPQSSETLTRALRDSGLLSGGAQESTARLLQVTTKALQDLGLSVAGNTKALEKSTQDLAGGLLSLLSGGLGGGGGGGGGLGGFLKGGFGLASLGFRIAGLFRGESEKPETLSEYQLPSSLSVEAANARNILSGFPQIDRGQSGEIRHVRPETAPQVVVNVSAMDSQSFMDRSNDIARAVRDAMIHMHPLNDVVGEI